MHPANKIVSAIPLGEIWDSDGVIAASRGAYLTAEAISGILEKHPVAFVVANCGDKLRWIEARDCYAFWKSGVKDHIADPVAPIELDKFPDQYAYIASEWSGEYRLPVILLEKVH